MLHLELDEWAYDIEQEFENNPGVDRAKLSHKHMVLCRIRDNCYDKYIRNYERESQRSCYWERAPMPRYCKERYGPPLPQIIRQEET